MTDSKKNCPICGSEKYATGDEVFSLADIFTRWRTEAGATFSPGVEDSYADLQLRLCTCADCGFGTFTPPVTGSAQFYADITQTGYYNKEKWEFWRALRDLPEGRPLRVFEAGCGEGDFLDFVKKYRPEITTFGYDVNPNAAQRSREKGHMVFPGDSLDVISPECKAEKFDVVFLFQLLEHFADPVEQLRKLSELVKPDGLLILGVPNAEGPIRYFHNSLTEIPPHHVSRWTARCFQSGMSQFGLQAVCIEEEPLPNYLWAMYLPRMWEDGFWPSHIHTISTPLSEKVDDKVRAFLCDANAFGLRWLNGVPGHSIYVVLTREGNSYTNHATSDHNSAELFKRFMRTNYSEEQMLERNWKDQLAAAAAWSAPQSFSDSTKSVEKYELKCREQNVSSKEEYLKSWQNDLEDWDRRINSSWAVRLVRGIRKILRIFTGGAKKE